MNKIYLMYHDIYKNSPDESGFQNISAFQYKISSSEFESHVKAIKEYCDSHVGIEVVFTFDDGGVSFLLHAAPILEKYGYKGVFFISTKYIDTSLFLSTEQLRELYDRGHIIGSHSHSHLEMSKLNDKEIDEEWSKSLKVLSEYSQHEFIASIPNGDTRNYVECSAAKHKINKLYTSTPTIEIIQKNGIDLIGRYVVYKGMTKDDVLKIVSSSFYRNKLYTKYLILRMVRIILGKYYNNLKSLIFGNR